MKMPIQWLRLGTAGDMGSIPHERTKTPHHMPCGAVKKKKKDEMKVDYELLNGRKPGSQS